MRPAAPPVFGRAGAAGRQGTAVVRVVLRSGTRMVENAEVVLQTSGQSGILSFCPTAILFGSFS